MYGIQNEYRVFDSSWYCRHICVHLSQKERSVLLMTITNLCCTHGKFRCRSIYIYTEMASKYTPVSNIVCCDNNNNSITIIMIIILILLLRITILNVNYNRALFDLIVLSPLSKSWRTVRPNMRYVYI